MTRAAIVTLLSVTSVACARGPSTTDAAGVLQQTAANISRIESGELFLRIEVSSRGRETSLEVDGPFALTSPGDLPRVDVDYKAVDDGAEERGHFVSTGQTATIVRDGSATPLSPQELETSGLRRLVRKPGQRSALDDINIASWTTGAPEITGGGNVGGVGTDKLAVGLNVAAVINALGDLSGALANAAPPELRALQGAQGETLGQATREAELELWTGREDRILRKLIATMEFGFTQAPLSGRLEELGGATLRLEASIERLNEPVTVEAP